MILYEPHLDFMRALEVYNAERNLLAQGSVKDLEIHLIMYKESTELYQYMSSVDSEKVGFKKLIDIKEKLYVELKNFKLEE